MRQQHFQYKKKPARKSIVDVVVGCPQNFNGFYNYYYYLCYNHNNDLFIVIINIIIILLLLK
jgi:hypothetical protein